MGNNNKQHKNTCLTLERKCPICNNIIKYSNKYTYNTANRKNTKCKSCTINDPIRKSIISSKFSGKNNPFYGKTHSEEVKLKISQSSKKYWENMTPEQLKQAKIICINQGEKNGMYNKIPYDIWVKKYGKEEADKRQREMKEKQYQMTPRGDENPMYGKPSPRGSGNGWKGWYKDFYFRSLRELSYVLYLDENNIQWESAEQKRFTIKYKNYDKTEKTYRPDFFVDRKKLIELKPKNLHNSVQVKLKSLAAQEWCLKNGYEYEIIDFKINGGKILQKLQEGTVTFDRDYKTRFLNYYEKNISPV